MAIVVFLVLGCALAFLVGSIPTGLLVGRTRGIDIRKHGSGNVGATNILRVLGTQWGVFVLLCDALKGYLAVTLIFDGISALVGPYWNSISIERTWPHELLHVVVGASVIAGHIWSVFLCFDGGKGVATSAGAIFGIDPLVAGIGFAIFLITVAISGYVSLGSILSTSSGSFISLLLARPASSVIFFALVAIVVWARHRENILRLKNGTEKKFRFSKRGTLHQ